MAKRRTAALITGGARGIGRATAAEFADDDDYDAVVLLDILETVYDVADELDGGVPYHVDVNDHDAVGEAVADAEEEQGLDITAAVNNAGITEYYWIGELEPESWDRVLDVNLKGQYNVARHVAPRMFERGYGSLVNISSGAGTKGSVSGGVHYSASKGGVLGLTRGLAKQLSPHVRVNCVVPGLIDTGMGSGEPDEEDDEGLFSEEGREKMIRLTPLQRLGQPDELASVIHFLSNEGASYMTGSVVEVNGGSHLMPTQEFLMPELSLKPDSMADE